MKVTQASILRLLKINIRLLMLGMMSVLANSVVTNSMAYSQTRAVVDQEVKKIILTTQGGGGHLQAAKRVEQDLTALGIKYLVVDVSSQGFLKRIIDVGEWGTKHWNAINSSGDIKAIKDLASKQWLAELVYGPRYYRKILSYLQKYPACDEIIDTQPLNSDEILKAIVAHNRQVLSNASGPATTNVTYRKIITDMPTPRSTHFWQSLARIQAVDAPYVTLVTPVAAGDLDGSKTADFYRRQLPQLMQGADLAGRSPLQLSFGPIRRGFLKQLAVADSKSQPLLIQAASVEELADIAEVSGLAARFAAQDATHLSLAVEKNAEVHSLMLGSQTQSENMLAYVTQEIELARQYYGRRSGPLYLFIFAGKNEGEASLFQRLCSLVRSLKAEGRWPVGLHLLPLSYQGDEFIGHLYSFADLILIRSGGLSCMEVEAVSRGMILIHSSDLKEKVGISADLIEGGIPNWEAGNALHVIDATRLADHRRRAFVVNQYLFAKVYGIYQAKFKGLAQQRPLWYQLASHEVL